MLTTITIHISSYRSACLHMMFYGQKIGCFFIFKVANKSSKSFASSIKCEKFIKLHHMVIKNIGQRTLTPNQLRTLLQKIYRNKKIND
jgi:hypothetical protein